MNPEQIQEDICGEFEFFENWEDKYRYLIDLGKELPAMAQSLHTEENLVRGCQSQVWLHGEYADGKLNFQADSDALIVKGLVALLMRVYNHQPPEAILSSQLFFIDRIGLSTHLSPTRSNGLASMVRQIKTYALAFSGKGG